MQPSIPTSLRICVASALGSTSTVLHANGFDLPDQDAFAVGRGMAFVATADNPSAIYYNPAGISQLDGHHLRGGVYGLHLGVEYDSPAGRSFDNENPWHAVPQVFYTYGHQKLRSGWASFRLLASAWNGRRPPASAPWPPKAA